jgi:outer membrane protein TolC
MNRSAVLLCASAAMLFLSHAAAAKGLAEADVIRLIKLQDPTIQVMRAAVQGAAAEQVVAGLYANPSLSWDGERLGSDEREDTWRLDLPFDLSGRRLTKKRLAAVGLARANAETSQRQTHQVVAALELFYRLVAAKHRAAFEGGSADRLAAAARVVARRVQAGASAGFDRARIDLEAELERSDMRSTEALVARLHSELALRLGLDPAAAHFAGALEADQALPGTKNPSDLPSLRLLRNAVKRSNEATHAARRSWIPALSLSGGAQVDGANASATRWVAGLSFELPVMNRGQGLRAAVGAAQSAAQAHYKASQTASKIATWKAVADLTALRAELGRMSEVSSSRIQALERAAQSGYREGTESLDGLLGVGRTSITLTRRLLHLTLEAKLAELRLRAARGEFE